MTNLKKTDFSGKKITIMGLGLNGGGLSAAKFFSSCNAEVTVTDMKSAEDLKESIDALKAYDIKYTLGCHKEEDFSEADIVIKNPAVRPNNKYLALAKHVETDLSIFLALCPAKVVAVTGSKGKSTTSSAIAHIVNECGKKAFLGGNITVSPLSFIDKVTKDDVVVLELSSWQLGDLKDNPVLKPFISIITVIVPDHLDRYGTMEAYVADKKLIYKNQDKNDWTICFSDDEYGQTFAKETEAKTLFYGSNIPKDACGMTIKDDFEEKCSVNLPDGTNVDLIVPPLSVKGMHNKVNICAAAIASYLLGIDAKSIQKAAQSFTGVEHRLEKVYEENGIVWINDSAATVPEAVKAASLAFEEDIVLITGGTDKKLNFETALPAYKKAKSIVLLEGSGSMLIKEILMRENIPFSGPYGHIEAAIVDAFNKAKQIRSSKNVVIMLSPGCTSFGMFKNEFDRGRCFKAAVLARFSHIL